MAISILPTSSIHAPREGERPQHLAFKNTNAARYGAGFRYFIPECPLFVGLFGC